MPRNETPERVVVIGWTTNSKNLPSKKHYTLCSSCFHSELPMSELLLHTCCAPCAVSCVRRLRDDGIEPVLFYSNANIFPASEYDLRLEQVRRLADIENLRLVVDVPDHADWLRCVACGFETEPEKGRRCSRCFRYSLQRTFEALEREHLTAFTTTLTVSPHKSSALIFETGLSFGSAFQCIDFKKQNGYQQSAMLTKQYGFYRQSYCGCEYSVGSPNLIA